MYNMATNDFVMKLDPDQMQYINDKFAERIIKLERSLQLAYMGLIMEGICPRCHGDLGAFKGAKLYRECVDCGKAWYVSGLEKPDREKATFEETK
jgi:hypothetical protein